MIEKGSYNFFNFLRSLFIRANFSFYILMISQWFKTKVHFGFCHHLPWKLSWVRVKINKKTWFWGIFSIFKFWNRFWYNLKQMYLINYQYFWSSKLFIKILTNNKIDLKHAVTMLLHQGCYLTCIYSCIKFYVKKWGHLEL